MARYSEDTRKKYRETVIAYVKEHPTATTLQLKQDLKVKLERVFENGLKQAYFEAHIPLPKPLLKRTRKQAINEAIQFIKDNPESTVTEIQNATNITMHRTFGSIKKAYDSANVPYPHRKGRRTFENLEMLRRAREFED